MGVFCLWGVHEFFNKSFPRAGGIEEGRDSSKSRRQWSEGQRFSLKKTRHADLANNYRIIFFWPVQSRECFYWRNLKGVKLHSPQLTKKTLIRTEFIWPSFLSLFQHCPAFRTRLLLSRPAARAGSERLIWNTLLLAQQQKRALRNQSKRSFTDEFREPVLLRNEGE